MVVEEEPSIAIAIVTPVRGVVHAYVGQNYLKRYIYLIFSNFFVSQN